MMFRLLNLIKLLIININLIFAFFEKVVGFFFKKKISPIIFILGPPRSGTTLLYQFCVNNFNFSYFNNINHYIFGFPVIGSFITSFLRKKNNKIKYISKYGHSEGLTSPSENGNWWRRFFYSRDKLSLNYEIKKNQVGNFKNSLNLFISYEKKPLIIKNLYNYLRLNSLLKYIDEPRFIVIKRDVIDNCMSILEARKTHSSLNQWWSVPINKNLKGADVYDQIISQVIEVNNHIIFTLKKNNANYLIVNFDDLIRKPKLILKKINLFLNENKNFLKQNIYINGIKKRRKKKFLKNKDYLEFKKRLNRFQYE